LKQNNAGDPIGYNAIELNAEMAEAIIKQFFPDTDLLIKVQCPPRWILTSQ
jgi:hypothetical protein